MTEIDGHRETVARFGCPIGTLCAELGKLNPTLAEHAALSLRLMVDWAEQQFRLMGRDDARDLGLEVIGRYEGAALLTNSLADPSVMRGQARRINEWIDAIAAQRAGT